MAFAVKIDFGGLVEATKKNNQPVLKIRDHDLNGSVEKYQPTGQDGSFVGTDIFGEHANPKNTYALIADLEVECGGIKLNKFVSITEGEEQSAVTKKYALEEVVITTKGGEPVKITASAKEIEDGADANNQAYYWIPAFSVFTKQEAQDVFGAFTMVGQNCHLTECESKLSCVVKPDDVEGVYVSSDCNSGVITVSGKILSTAGVKPTVTPKAEAVSLGNQMTSNWVLTNAPKLTESNPEKAAKEYSFELQLALKKFRVVPEAET